MEYRKIDLETGVYKTVKVKQGVKETLSGTGSVVLENVVGDWVELSIHGRSDQQTTTGAQLLNIDVNGNAGDYINISDGIITINSGASGRMNFFQIPEKIYDPNEYTMSVVPLDSIKNDGTLQIKFSIYENPILGENPIAATGWYVGGNVQGTNGIGKTEITEKKTAKYLNVDIVKGNFTGQRFMLMLNSGATALPWEPYTGNQPSPDPDYPQEIKKSGKKTAQFIPFNIGQEISSVNGYAKAVCKSDGIYVELKTGVNTTAESDMYFAGNRASNSESGYAECPEITPGRYTIASDSVNMLFYCVVWRNGTNMVNGPATASESVTFDVEAGDKFRIFLRPSITTPGNYVVRPVLVQGETALPWEPYGYSIETTIDNAGYLEKGSRSDLVKMIPLEKGHKYRLFSTEKNSNKNTFVFADQNLTFAGGNALYSYGINKGYVNTNGTGIVSGECRLKGAWNPAVEFTVTEDGLYLYYGLNGSGLSDDEIWIWTGDGYLTDTPYQEQTIAAYTPNGLPGIPVTSGGNYTDETGQQWVTDEIDFGRGKYVQRVIKQSLTSDMSWLSKKTSTFGNYNFQFNGITKGKNDRSMCNFLPYRNTRWDDTETNLPKIYVNGSEITASFPPDSEINTLQAWENLLDKIGDCYIYYCLATPVETDLSDAEIEAYKALHTYKPATIITAFKSSDTDSIL